ncbi:hypothetical protein BGZ80_003296 [Entomortierella chlamydospora]|uniref:mRNA export factor GLE1 n=1 Tax=Entomortierella chlamydospora TaxID=101097 RepID=A0A9P6MNC9_9FUNG|nr:hypothetical protein BGZ80_003296 [Entomortierella chlamydospora]
MATNELPLELILRRSITDGPINPDDLELTKLRLSQKQGLSSPLDEEEEQDYILHHNNHIPLSKNPSIYYQKIGLTSTQRTKPTKSIYLNTFNSRASRSRSGEDAVSHRSGYGLSEFSSSEEEVSSEDDNYSYDTSDSEEEAFPLSSRRYANPGRVLPDADGRSQEMAHYVAHITGRIDPWELKRVAPHIAQKIADDFKSLETLAKKPTVSWDNGDIAQRLKAMTLDTEAIKEKRKKETEAKNQALTKEIENCLARIKEERETAIRLREEAIKQAQQEKERLAKEQEDKAKALAAQKEAQEKKASEEAAAKAEKAKKAAEAAAQKASAGASAIFVSEAANAEYQRYIKVLEHIRSVVLPAVTGNPQLKKFCFGARREIVASIGQLVNRRSEILRVATEIDGFFNTTKSQNESAYNWVLNCTAKKLVKQAETEALVKSAPTFPLAHVAVLLFTNHPLFLDVLMARFAKKCPYVTPMYIQKDPNDTAEEYMEKLAYKKTGKGHETEAQYNARQCAMFTLYCAILQTNPPGKLFSLWSSTGSHFIFYVAAVY